MVTNGALPESINADDKDMNRLRNGWGRRTVVRYIAVSAMAHGIWEFAHMPLYDVWARGTTSEIIYNGLHCTVGDVMIASFALLVGVLAGRYGKWPDNRRAAVFVRRCHVNIQRSQLI